MPQIKLIGKNKDFFALWDCEKQQYKVYKGSTYLITKYRFEDVKTYLN